MAVFSTDSRRKNQFSAYFDSTILTNDGGIILIDIKITKWDGYSLNIGFLYASWHFEFNLPDKDINKIKTKLLLGIPVCFTVPAEYSII